MKHPTPYCPMSHHGYTPSMAQHGTCKIKARPENSITVIRILGSCRHIWLERSVHLSSCLGLRYLGYPPQKKHDKHIHKFPNIFPLETLSWFYSFSWYRSNWCFHPPCTAQDQSDKHLFVHLNCLNGLDRRVHLQLKVGSEKWGILNFWGFFLGNMFENNDKPR